MTLKNSPPETDPNCPFCWSKEQFPPSAQYESNALMFAINNITPLTKDHFMTISFQHGIGYTDLSPAQVKAIHALTSDRIKRLEESENKPAGYSIAVNNGYAAGQTVVGHLHMHVMPRYADDVQFGSLTHALQKRLKPVNETQLTKGHFTVSADARRYADIKPDEMVDVHQLIKEQLTSLQNSDETITGFNLIVNDGAGAGQEIAKTQFHVVPRRLGDMRDEHEIDRPGGVMRAIKRELERGNQPV